MEIRFYTITDPRNTIGKKLGSYVSTFVKLKYQDLNITTPTFLLKFMEYPNYNYIHIPALRRYYFINDIVVKTDNTFEIHCACDVLESFKDDILKGTGHLTKSESYNTYTDDDYPQNVNYEVEKITKECNFDFSKTNIVLVTIGG